MLGSSTSRLGVSKPSYFWDSCVALLWLRSPSHHVHTLDTPLLHPAFMGHAWTLMAPNLCQGAQLISTGHSQQASLGSALCPHHAPGPPWSSRLGSFVGGTSTRFGCHTGTGHTLEVVWITLLVGHTKICCSRKCQSSSGCLPPQVTPLVHQQWCEPLPACSTDHSLSTQLPQQWDASMGTSQGRGVGTSSPWSHISRTRVYIRPSFLHRVGGGQIPPLQMGVAGGCSHRWKDRGHSTPWISFPPRQGGWERPLAPDGLLLESPCPVGQPLLLGDAVGLGPSEEDPGPEDKVTRAVQGVQRCPGVSWIPTDTGAKLSSPWMWSSSAPGVHSTSGMEQPRAPHGISEVPPVSDSRSENRQFCGTREPGETTV